MKTIQANGLSFSELNRILRESGEACKITGCLGQRFLAAGMADRSIAIEGVPGNALGAYLNGAHITVYGNAQDAVGDTMNEGTIVIHGNIGDAAGYAMRGGAIFIEGNAGYRAGIHMKAYQEKVPVMVIGGTAGSFLGEYQAGGTILVLGLGNARRKIVGFFPCAGMHGGKMILRGNCAGVVFPEQVIVRPADETDRKEIESLVTDYCNYFDADRETIMDAPFTVVLPNDSNPYRQLYIAN